MSKNSESTVAGVIAASGYAELSNEEKMLVILEASESDVRHLITVYNAYLKQWQKNPEKCNPLECTEDEAIGWVNGLQFALRIATMYEYDPIFIETKARKEHNEKSLKKQKDRKKDK